MQNIKCPNTAKDDRRASQKEAVSESLCRNLSDCKMFAKERKVRAMQDTVNMLGIYNKIILMLIQWM